MIEANLIADGQKSGVRLHQRSAARLRSVQADLESFAGIFGEHPAGPAAEQAAEWISTLLRACEAKRIESRKDRQLPKGDRT